MESLEEAGDILSSPSAKRAKTEADDSMKVEVFNESVNANKNEENSPDPEVFDTGPTADESTETNITCNDQENSEIPEKTVFEEQKNQQNPDILGFGNDAIDSEVEKIKPNEPLETTNESTCEYKQDHKPEEVLPEPGVTMKNPFETTTESTCEHNQDQKPEEVLPEPGVTMNKPFETTTEPTPTYNQEPEEALPEAEILEENEEEQVTEEYMEAETEEEPPYVEPDYSYEQLYFPSETLTELASYKWDTSLEKQQYTKGCLWSPDGTCCLVGVNGDGMHLMELPQDLYAVDKLDISRTSSELKSAVHVPEAGMVYDFCWYPFMNSSSPETCLWISTRQHEPIHMWDAFDGSRRASYLGYDDADEVQAAIVVKFSDDGEKIFGGYKKSIKIFDTALPGRICNTIKIKQAASAFALTPTNPDLITTGTWSGNINLFDMRMPKNGCMSSLFGHKSGVTLIKYNYDATLLYSGSRKEDSLFIWDMRNFSEPLKTLKRSINTNQRVFFDLSVGGYWFASGDTDGVLRLWNTVDGEYDNERKFDLHEDCCNGVSFHPSRPIIATSSGQFKFPNLNEDSETKENEFPTDFENTLKFWWIGDLQNKVDV